MAQTEKAHGRTSSTEQRTSWSWKRLFGSSKDESQIAPPTPPLEPQQEQRPGGLARRLSRKVIPGLPRAGTFKRQQSELRDRLEPVKPNVDERRAVSVDRRTRSGRSSSAAIVSARLSAPELFEPTAQTIDGVLEESTLSRQITQDAAPNQEYVEVEKEPSFVETRSISTENYEDEDEQILAELESKWILNLSMHFRDKSKREKFFVTYAETPTHWRRVTISLDYRDAPPGSLEEELQRTRFQRDKSARIYEAIRESLPDIQFYDTVTNLKLQTENERLHVHVVEDLSEIISYPPIKSIKHLNCRRVREEDLVFDSHLSGFVYKVRVGGQVFIKKEIPGPDTVDEFLYEINALHQLSGSRSVIQFGGVVLDNKNQSVKGLLISFAEKGALIDVIYDGEGQIPWQRRERWARQIVQGLSEIHEAGFVQGDFTLSNIVIDEDDNAKIIDINRRGCPVGWEPPEVAALIESSQRISMYIGVKSDLYQLGMVLYALATQQDEPENHRPLNLTAFPREIPDYYWDMCHRCLNVNPRCRSQASALLTMFPPIVEYYNSSGISLPIVVDACHVDDLPLTNSHNFATHNVMSYPNIPYLEKPIDVYDYAVTDTSDEADYPRRGRSPPAPYRRENLPFEIPLPPSSSGSDATASPATAGAEELTPIASRVGENDADLSESTHSMSHEQEPDSLDVPTAGETFPEELITAPAIANDVVVSDQRIPPSPPPSYQEILLVEEKGVTNRIVVDLEPTTGEADLDTPIDAPLDTSQEELRGETELAPEVGVSDEAVLTDTVASGEDITKESPSGTIIADVLISVDAPLEVRSSEAESSKVVLAKDPQFVRVEEALGAVSSSGHHVEVPVVPNQAQDANTDDMPRDMPCLAPEILDTDVVAGETVLLEQSATKLGSFTNSQPQGEPEITPIISMQESKIGHGSTPATYEEIPPIPQQTMESQSIPESPVLRETAAMLDTSTDFPELAFVGTHIEICSIPEMAMSSGPDFDELTTDTHNDRIVLENLVAG